MTDKTEPRRRRGATIVIVVVLVVVIAAVVIAGFVTAGNARPGATTGAPTTGTTASTVPSSATSSSAPTVAPTSTSTSTTKPSSTPQPTKTATISSAAPIAKELTAKVNKVEAVQGKADGPGEIAGPAVRFTITITNTTGKTVNLSNTVVNAYYGSASSPANELQAPGGDPFPSSVKTGATAKGVFVFTIPKDQRSKVLVTVDTSVKNPVVAFRGSAPR